MTDKGEYVTTENLAVLSVFRILQTDPYLSFICGGAAGALSRTAVSPMERVKVLFQVQGSGSGQSYKKGTLSTIAQIYREEGYKGLFRGNGINCIRIVPYTAIQYSVYENLKQILTNGERNLSTSEKLLCGMVGGIASVGGTYPMDLVKTRLSVLTARSLKGLNSENTVVKKIDLSMWGNLKTIYLKEGGIKGLYRGFIPTSLGVAPYVSLNFSIFEKMKEDFKYIYPNWQNESKTIETSVILLIGALSGGIAQSMVYPFDILRRRFQVATMNDGSLGFKYNNTLHALTSIVKQEGIKGLYKGWTANMWKIMPSMAVQWASYDFIRRFIVDL
jgi:solute carrier family 25 phosphate transporter 23/24/25/41